MKALIIADLHLHHLPTWRFEWCKKFVDKMLDEYGAREGYHLILLGDALEIRDRVDSRVLNLLLRLILQWRGGDVIWVSGQHDSYIPNRATLHGLNMTKLDNGEVLVVDEEPLEHELGWFVPFERRIEDYRHCLMKVPDGAIVFTHMPTKEIIEMYGAKDVDGISVKEFSRFKSTISGDIHKFYDFPELSYVGAPSQRDWRDKGVEGKIGIIEYGEFSRIDIEHPKHIEVDSEKEVPEDGKYIVRTLSGVHVRGKNVISSTEIPSVDVKSMKVISKQNINERLENYVKNNIPPVSKEKAIEFAEGMIK